MSFAMQPVFRHILDQEIERPNAGDLLICLPRNATEAGHALARRVLKEGLSAFPQGTPPIERIIVPVDPTLDDLLAAEFARLLLEGQALPAGARAFADYTAAIRSGYKPDPLEVPLECSLEGVFQALRRSAGPDLSLKEAGGKFNAKWPILGRRILAAANEGLDPTVTPFRVEGSEFVQERDSLRRDHDVFDQDVRSGAEWSVKIRTTNGKCDGYGLLLRDPKSKFFKYWSRDRQSHLHGEPYSLLAVKEGAARWTLSTDPVLELSLKGLQEKLQSAEAAAKPQHAAEDPWYDGARHQFSIVASPKSGTALTENQVLGVVCNWTQAKPMGKGRGVSKPRLIVAAALIVGAGLFWQGRSFFERWTAAPVVPGTPVGKLVERDLPTHREQHNFQLEGGKPSATLFTPYNPSKSVQPVNLNVHLVGSAKGAAGSSGAQLSSVEVKVNGKPIVIDPKQLEGKSGEIALAHLKTSFICGENSVIVTALDANRAIEPWSATLDWSFDTGRLPNLYVLTIGISKYKLPQYRLNYASDDATSLTEAFAKDKGLLFGKVKVRQLLNEEAQRERIISALFELQEATQDDLVIVCVSGHGAKGNGERFYLLPWEWECQDESHRNSDLVSKAVSWEEDFLAPLGALPCQVLVLLDTCHSGAAVGTRGLDMEQEFQTAIEDAVQRKRRNSPGMVVMAACLPDQSANEKAEWGHGVCTLAFLEGLQGQIREGLKPTQSLPRGEVVSLQDLSGYVSARVRDLTGGKQAVVTKTFRAVSLEDIPITVHDAATTLR